MAFEFVYKWTSEMTPKQIHDFLSVFNDTFGSQWEDNYFQWKYQDNVYGDSLHVIGYDGDKPIHCRAFWRNDCGSVVAYQPVDTSVLPEYQGKGIFRKTTLEALEILKESYIYNYPNSNSRPGYLKLGWNIKQEYPITFNLANIVKKRYQEVSCLKDDYVRWRFLNHPTKRYYVTESKGQYFLLTKRQPFCYAILGKLMTDYNFPRVNPLLIFSYNRDNFLFRLPRKRVIFLENKKYTGIEFPLQAASFDML